jgi:hypothetical protein
MDERTKRRLWNRHEDLIRSAAERIVIGLRTRLWMYKTINASFVVDEKNLYDDVCEYLLHTTRG